MKFYINEVVNEIKELESKTRKVYNVKSNKTIILFVFI